MDFVILVFTEIYRGQKSKIWNIESPIQSHKSNALYPPVSFQTFSLHVPEITFFPQFFRKFSIN